MEDEPQDNRPDVVKAQEMAYAEKPYRDEALGIEGQTSSGVLDRLFKKQEIAEGIESVQEKVEAAERAGIRVGGEIEAKRQSQVRHNVDWFFGTEEDAYRYMYFSEQDASDARSEKRSKSNDMLKDWATTEGIEPITVFDTSTPSEPGKEQRITPHQADDGVILESLERMGVKREEILEGKTSFEINESDIKNDFTLKQIFEGENPKGLFLEAIIVNVEYTRTDLDTKLTLRISYLPKEIQPAPQQIFAKTVGQSPAQYSQSFVSPTPPQHSQDFVSKPLSSPEDNK